MKITKMTILSGVSRHGNYELSHSGTGKHGKSLKSVISALFDKIAAELDDFLHFFMSKTVKTGKLGNRGEWLC